MNMDIDPNALADPHAPPYIRFNMAKLTNAGGLCHIEVSADLPVDDPRCFVFPFNVIFLNLNWLCLLGVSVEETCVPAIISRTLKTIPVRCRGEFFEVPIEWVDDLDAFHNKMLALATNQENEEDDEDDLDCEDNNDNEDDEE